MAVSDYVCEIIMDEWPEWTGNELYSTKELAQFFGIQDFENAFYDKWKAGYDDAEEPGEFKWEFISKGLYHLYEDGNPTGVALKFRFVHTGGSKA
jgi:hypothetical protein